MGSRIAPPLAILFMNAAQSLILARDEILQPVIYMRYIDVIGIWTHGSQALDKFLNPRPGGGLSHLRHGGGVRGQNDHTT